MKQRPRFSGVLLANNITSLSLLIFIIITVNNVSSFNHDGIHGSDDFRSHHKNSKHSYKRQNEPALDSSSYRRTVIVQNDGEKPVESNYFWLSNSNPSSSNHLPTSSAASDNANKLSSSENQLISETISRRIKTTTTTGNNGAPLSTNNKDSAFNVIEDSSSKSSPKLSSTNDNINEHLQELSNSERVNYNITIIRDLVNVPSPIDFDLRKPCPANHYGDQLIGCKKCDCNDNIDVVETGNCDPLTGRCLKCLFNTEGDHCERCRLGFAGDARTRSCRECLCNKLGTQPGKGAECDQQTGQCQCLAHVEALDCGKCSPGYFNLTSAVGCQSCQCDSRGSVGQNCNEFDGKCECHSGYGGLKCNECPSGYYGDPIKGKCQACACHTQGSSSQVCDNRTGKCACSLAYGGDKCDRCARGYSGIFPSCESCGECWEQWAWAVSDLHNQTQALLDRVRLLLEIGTVGAYGPDFQEIENQLDRIKNILDNQRLKESDIRALAEKIKQLNDRLRALEKAINELEYRADDVKNRTHAVQQGLRDYGGIEERLTILIQALRENATSFQAANVDEAHKIILDSQNRSRMAAQRVRELKPLMNDQEHLRRATDYMLITMSSRFNSSSLQNEALLAMLERQIYDLEQGVPNINQLVCASSSTVNTCDQLCGGSLCNKCGGLSCSEGATTKASNALDLAQQAWLLLNQKFNQSRSDLDQLDEAKRLSEEALKQAKSVLADCELQKAKFDKVGHELNGIMDGVDKFYLMDGAKPAEVRTLGNECLALSISLKPEQILDLARKINETLSSLTNIDKILRDTADDLNTAEQLHQQADRAKDAADNILETVEQVLAMLRLAALEQARAAAAIAAANGEIEGAQLDLNQIGIDSELLARLINELALAIKGLQDRLNELRKKFAQTELYLNQARSESEELTKLTDQAERDTNEVADKVRQAEEKLLQKAKLNGELRDRAEKLKNEANLLADDIAMKVALLRELDDTFDQYLERVKDYQNIVDDLHRQMNEYLKDIDSKAQMYRDCQP